MKDEKELASFVGCVLIVGDPARVEFASVLEWIDGNLVAVWKTNRVRDIAGAVRLIGTGVFPDLVLVLQSWSNEYSVEEVHQLLALTPLARLVVCYGPWCESDGRNYSVWPVPVRVPCWAAKRRLEREWRSILNPHAGRTVPWSASRDEVFAADHPALETSTEPQSFLVDSPDPAFREYLSELMRGRGHVASAGQPEIILFDADPWPFERPDVLRRLSAEHPRSAIHALLNFDSPSLVAQLKQTGAHKISTKLGFCPIDPDAAGAKPSGSPRQAR